MESVDVKKLETAIVYLQRISDGNNPVNNMPASDDSVLNDPNVIRCMFFVKEVLEEVKRNGGYIGGKMKKKDKLEYPLEKLNDFAYEEDKSITKIVAQLNEAIDTDVYKKISYKSITQWLKTNEFLEERNIPELNKIAIMPTKKGIDIGIRTEMRTSFNGKEYTVVIYNKQAQEYIVSNMEQILNFEEKNKFK